MKEAVPRTIMNEIYCCDCVEGMRLLPAEVIPLTVTSPPYDAIRTWQFPWEKFQAVAQELYRLTIPGGIVAWVVQDQHHDWSESGTSFKQALYFKELGFKLYTTIAVERTTGLPGYRPRYWPPLEYVFVLSRGRPRSYNLIRDRPTTTRSVPMKLVTLRSRDGTFRRERRPLIVPPLAVRNTVWRYKVGYGHTTTDREAHGHHPALMPEELAKDLILSYSRPDDFVFDPMAGLATTCKMALLNGRSYLGFDRDQQFCRDARKRLAKYRREKSTRSA